jgi:hypothetical protein
MSLDAFDKPKLNQEGIYHLNRSITNNKIKAVIKSFPTEKSQAPDEFTGGFYQPLKKN